MTETIKCVKMKVYIYDTFHQNISLFALKTEDLSHLQKYVGLSCFIQLSPILVFQVKNRQLEGKMFLWPKFALHIKIKLLM